MIYNISFPGKTFLIGEYAALEQAPAILVNTKPRFYFSITKGNCVSYFHPKSPADQWLKKYPEISQFYHIESQDPYSGRGGFGLSSVQFNLVYLLGCLLKKQSPEKIDLLKMWKAYRNLEFFGQKPSGADIISQWMGNLCLFTPDPFHIYSIKWPFPNLDFFLIHTGVSLNTWEHLNQIRPGKSFVDLSVLVKKSVAYVENSDAEGFVATIKEYASYLEKKNLVYQKTKHFLHEIKKIEQIIAAKGCGALGAEVIVVFFHQKNKEIVKNILNKRCFLSDSRNEQKLKIGNEENDIPVSGHIVADSSCLSQGMRIH